MSEIRNHGPYIGEDDFKKELKSTVRPYIYKYMTEGYMDTYDNRKLHYLFFIAPDEKASINLIHGKGEYFEKYEGYISSHNGKRADDETLAKIAKKIQG